MDLGKADGRVRVPVPWETAITVPHLERHGGLFVSISLESVRERCDSLTF
jgi:hypothetical protein